MMHSLFPHRHSPFREARLLGRNVDAAPEVQKAKELMQNPRAKLAELQDVITKGLQTQKESGEFIDTLARELNRENSEQVLRNLDELTKDTTDTSLGALRSTIHQLKERMNTVTPSALQPANTTEGTPAEQPSFLNRVGTGIGNTAETISNTVLPKNWSESLSRPQKIAIGSALTLGAGVVLWQLGKMLFGRGKKSAEAGKEAAANAKGGFFKKLLIGTGIGLAAFFGLRYMMGKFGKDIEQKISNALPGLPSPEVVKPYLDGAEAASGIGGGITSKTAERIGAQADALKEIPLAIQELSNANSYMEAAEIAAKRGGMLLYKEGKWIWDNGVQAVTIPIDAATKLYNGEYKDAWEGGWLYGEAGAAYVLGKATLTGILTGKIRIPASSRSVAMTAGRMAGWPLMVGIDGLKTIRLMIDPDGRIIAKNAITRWGPAGWIRDTLAQKSAAKGTMESLESGMEYFKSQMRLIEAMKQEVDGPFKGMVRAESIASLEKANTGMAKTLAESASKVKKELLENGAEVPKWIESLSEVRGMDKVENILAETDKAGAVWKNAQAAGKTADAAEAITEAAKAVDTVDDVAENTRLFDRLVEAIAAARKLGNNEQLLKLLQSPIIQTMAKQGNRVAQSLQHVWRLVAPGMKWAGRAFAVIGPLIDAALIIANRYELADARKTGNQDLIKTLESKQTALVGGGIASAGILALSTPGVAVALPLTIGATIYTQGVYDSMATWQKSPEDWFAYSPEDLRAKLEEYKMGKIDRGHRAAFGYSTAYSMWRWGTSWSKESKEKNRQEDEQQGEGVESVNQNVRQEILMAYFMKTQLQPHEGETQAQYKERVTPQLRDRLSYIKRFTSGTYDASILGERFFEQAGDYADLMAVRRAQQIKEIRYNSGSEEKVLDLTALDYIGNDNLNNDAGQMRFLQTMHQYEKDVKIQKEAVEDLYRMNVPLA